MAGSNNSKGTSGLLIFLIILLAVAAVVISDNSKTSEASILFLGDTSLGKYYQEREPGYGRENILETKGYDHPFENFKGILSDSDYVIANLEAPITDISVSPYEGVKDYLNYDDQYETPRILKKVNIKAVSLSNNHMMDFGKEGLLDTIASLDKSHIESFGAGTDDTQANKPLVIDLPLSEKLSLVVISGFEFRENYHSDYHYYAEPDKSGVSRLDIDSVREIISDAKRTHPNSFIIIFPHWGNNYQWKSGEQEGLAKGLIDSGADLVIGHGAHLLQEPEVIGNRYVIYNIGNFVFNSPGRYEQQNMHPYSLIARLMIKNEGLAMSLRLYPIFTNNLITNYQGRFVTKEEFDEVMGLIMNKSSLEGNQLKTGNDSYGYYFELEIEQSATL